MTSLPIDSVLSQLKELLTASQRVILQAETGAGKSTRVPLALMEEPWLQGRKIVMLEPRRLAARSVATWMARTLGEEPGQQVGWQIRNDYRPGSVVEVVTEGILNRRLQGDPELAETALVIFDEFHERSLHADLALALCREVQEALRPDLKLLLMSATLDADTLCRELQTEALVRAKGRLFPVEVRHLARPLAAGGQALLQATVRAVLRALEEEGDVLVFLPGAGEIRRVVELLEETLAGRNIVLAPLFGGLSFGEQQRAIQPDGDGRRRVVVATNIAETSLTIEGIGSVVDSGLVRRAQFDPGTGMSRLVTRQIARSAAEQRRGRAGRLGPGVCFRLWTEAEEQAMKPGEEEEITHSDLARLALDLAAWGVQEADGLPWLTRPPQAAFNQGRALLQRLGFVDGGGITASGRKAAQLGLEPRLAALLLHGRSRRAALLAALLGERDLFRRGSGCDVAARLAALEGYLKEPGKAVRRWPLLRSVAEQVTASLRGLERVVEDGKTALSPGGLLALAWPERVARRKAQDVSGRVEFLFAGGGSGFLPPEDSLAAAEWLVVAAVDGRRSGGRIHLAAEYSQAELEEQFAGEIAEAVSCRYEKEKQRLEVMAVRRLGRLVLAKERITRPDQAQVEAALLEAIREERLALLPWTEKLNHWLARARWLAAQSGFDWPELGEEQLLAELERWLGPFLAGISSVAGLAKVDLRYALTSLLTSAQQAELEREAPARFVAPSGRTLPIHYRPEQGPVVSVKLQEMFGQTDSPRLARGSVPLIFELLSPAGRPIQTTADLAGFWCTSYHEVAKEMRGRYPKHRWPEEPLAEKAGASLKRR